MPEKRNSSTRSHQHTLWVWLEDFAACVRSKDYVKGRKLFAPDAHGFGTIMKSADTRARLERMQWAKVWPETSGFRFERAGARITVSADASMAVVMVTWKSCGQPAPKRLVFDRRGRATVVLSRTGPGGAWLAVHTHFSFDPAASGQTTSVA